MRRLGVICMLIPLGFIILFLFTSLMFFGFQNMSDIPVGDIGTMQDSQENYNASNRTETLIDPSMQGEGDLELIPSKIEIIQNFANYILGLLIIPMVILLLVGVILFFTGKKKEDGENSLTQNIISESWKTAKPYIWKFFLVGVIYLIVTYSIGFILILTYMNVPLLETDLKSIIVFTYILPIIDSLIELILGLGIVSFTLQITKGDNPNISHIFTYFRELGKGIGYIFAYIIVSIIVVIGLILLIIPGIIWAIKLQFFPYFIIEQGMGPIDAIKASRNLTAGHKRDIFIFNLMKAGVVSLGVLVLGIGIIRALPTVFIADAIMYQRLKNVPKIKNKS